MDFNKNKGFIITLIVGIILTIILLVLWRGAEGAYEDTVIDTESAQDTYQRLVKEYGGAPTEEMVESKKQQVQELISKAQEMRAAAVDAPLPSYNATTFKSELRTTRDTFQDFSQERNIRIPEDIGFAEFLGAKVPERSDLPKLTRQFVIVRSIMNVLFSNNVEEVGSIDRNIAGDDNRTGGMDFMDEDVMFADETTTETEETVTTEAESQYDSVPVSFQFRVNPKNLYSILAGIRNSEYFLRVRNIDTRKEVVSTGTATDPSDIYETLTVECVIDHVKLAPKETK